MQQITAKPETKNLIHLHDSYILENEDKEVIIIYI